MSCASETVGTGAWLLVGFVPPVSKLRFSLSTGVIALCATTGLFRGEKHDCGRDGVFHVKISTLGRRRTGRAGREVPWGDTGCQSGGLELRTANHRSARQERARALPPSRLLPTNALQFLGLLGGSFQDSKRVWFR